jgi:hypothetical protein
VRELPECPWEWRHGGDDARLCARAARAGSLAVLRWAQVLVALSLQKLRHRRTDPLSESGIQ